MFVKYIIRCETKNINLKDFILKLNADNEILIRIRVYSHDKMFEKLKKLFYTYCLG